jgi:hypothetical protein
MNSLRITAAIFLLVACGSSSPCDGTKCLNGEVCDATTGLCVQGSDGQSKNGSRLHVRVLKGEDGSQLPAGLFDIERNEACGEQLADDGTTRCMPIGVTPQNFFSDAACMVSLFAVQDNDCTTPGYLAFTTPACGAGVKLQKLSPIATPATVYSIDANGPACVARATVPAAKQWLQGAAAPASSFVKVQLQ